jgi:hypothetical protein
MPSIRQVIVDENTAQVQALREEFKKLSKRAEELEVQIGTKNNAVLPVCIITLLIAAANLIIMLLHIYGIM